MARHAGWRWSCLEPPPSVLDYLVATVLRSPLMKKLEANWFEASGAAQTRMLVLKRFWLA